MLRAAGGSVTALEHLRVGPWNIPEPEAIAPILNPEHLQYALIPGRAFDQHGWRIGHGGAGYDLWIRSQREQNKHTIFWGIAFECQLLPEIPHVEHDEQVDGIVTARGLTITNNRE